ncbi:MAG: SRPBCC family protein [Gaiellales bacterium]
MAEQRVVEREVTLPVGPEEAWELVTDPDHLERWFAPEVDLRPVEGSEVVIRWEDQERRGTVEHVQAPRRIAIRWESDPPTMVEIILEPAPGGTRIGVVERELPRVEAIAAEPLPGGTGTPGWVQGGMLLAA